jgi:hypothetical protein
LFARKSAENIVKLAETLFTAEDELSPKEFRRFCEDVGLDPEGSTFKKLKKIGESVSRFEPFIERMPNAWTTVYKFASLKDHDFDRVAKSKLFTPFMTAQDVNSIVDGHKPKTERQNLLIDLSKVEQSVQIDLYHKVKAVAEQFGLSLTAPEKLEAVANNVVTDSVQAAA